MHLKTQVHHKNFIQGYSWCDIHDLWRPSLLA
jgi:desulfoferrodoxin (superoxide reductase-like protein)